MGISGPMIEWMKILYDRIRYMVRLDGRFAAAFRSLLGILTGDGLSTSMGLVHVRFYSRMAPRGYRIERGPHKIFDQYNNTSMAELS
jgi:hypothetical protein